MAFERIAPNLDPANPGDTYVVETEDEHEITLRVRPTGPHTAGYIISFISAEPPITEASYYESEVFVKNNELTRGEEFELSTFFPILSQTAFRATEILTPDEAEAAKKRAVARASQQ
jgi:hypothetical protein